MTVYAQRQKPNQAPHPQAGKPVAIMPGQLAGKSVAERNAGSQ
tara:strand:+ start:71555 stop:71683 length:129 start_codon:yes stop_codon:yes gene_type:complete